MSPDISMCRRYECPRRMKCHRYTARPDKERQPYITWCEPYNDPCESFWDNKDYPNDIRDEKIILGKEFH